MDSIDGYDVRQEVWVGCGRSLANVVIASCDCPGEHGSEQWVSPHVHRCLVNKECYPQDDDTPRLLIWVDVVYVSHTKVLQKSFGGKDYGC